MKWNKKSQTWHSVLKPPKKIRKEVFTCPKCGKDVRGKSWSKGGDISLEEWQNLSVKKLLDKYTMRCSSCFEETPYSKFPDKARKFFELEITKLRGVHSDIANAVVFNRTGRNIEGGGLSFKLGISSGLKGIEIICGNCGKKNHFKVQNEKDKLLQCLNCGHFNKVIF